MAPTSIIFPIIKTLAKLTPWLVRLFYRKEKIEQNITVYLSASGDCITFNQPASEATIWFTITNKNPFSITLDRIELYIVTDGASSRIQNIIPRDLKSLEDERIFARGTFCCAKQSIEVAKQERDTRLEITGFVTSKICNSTFIRNIEQIKNTKVIC